MKVHGRLSGGGLGLAVVAMTWALSVISPAVAVASPGVSHGGRAAPLSGDPGMSLSQAPAGLRAAVQRTIGAGGPSVPALKQHAELTASDGATGDDFGLTVSLSGSTAVVGAPFHSSATGSAYVFVHSGGAWTEQAELTASDGAANDHFGWAVSVSGSTAIVGAPFHNSSTGAVYVFAQSGGTWTQTAELTASDAAANDYFGWSVGLSGSSVLVGAPFSTSATGAAYVFVQSGGAWTQQAEVGASDAAPSNFFGYRVALSGSTAVVGAPYHNSATGTAYVFVQSGGAWTQQAELAASDGASGDELGFSVAASGSTVVVGAPFHNSATGAAYVFGPSGATWSQRAELTASNGLSGDEFAFSVAASKSTVVVGAPDRNSGAGMAYVFVHSNSRWSQLAKLSATDAAASNNLGYSVAASAGAAASTLLIGSPYNNSNTGAAYVYRVSSRRS